MNHHKKSSAGSKAQPRDRYALDRTALANERTYLAWSRTGLASLAGGLGTEKYLGGVIPVMSLRFMATSLIIFSMLCFLISAWRYRTLHVDLKQLDIKMLPIFVVMAVSIVFTFCSILALIGLWDIL